MFEWFGEFLLGLGKIFLHPLLYIGAFYAVFLGYLRVKRERKNFHIRAQDGLYEWRTYGFKGITIGLVVSAVIILVGIPVPFAFIITVAAVSLLLAFFIRPQMLSASLTAGVSFFILYFMTEFEYAPPIFEEAFQQVNANFIPLMAVIAGLLVMAEGFLIITNGMKNTSPKIVLSKRGQRVGVHESKRLWMVPILFLLPEGFFHAPFDWWPVLTLGETSYSIILVPYWIGFAQQIQGMLPSEAIRLTGNRVLLLAALVLAISIVGIWYPVASIIAVAVAIIGRECISFIQRYKDDSMSTYFSKRNNGLMILGIIPYSAADHMGLQVGEIITKVNGTTVNNGRDFYIALQKNSAFCKLEVLDTNGEIRFAQRALFEGEHHELGLLFIGEEKHWESYAG